ncbi:catechol 2,3-dioxygenase-like lactoylglutathione lyase family enzyme [Spinactinospora alkalitolerans]|uniref:Catechol 2,3-dioxygenase-like lactoylglutathione lyase family enzyme n=1 Tax=Spinactinospora alkalitolerans TaxID=687207 RepID=A0A852U267_9ACTN|nr:VOC family protein [Spinactinospora alkalitolerans]NYE50289.1 catechol 2,3-dioxygenase-like lactoylglutathione lyase family enzyme [Spinactinospora alkalitolerans]
MTAFYHVCFAVPDLEAAMRDLRGAAGVEWSEPKRDRLAEWDYRIVFTRGGPPFIELIEGPAGSPWDASDGPRFDHLGYWSDSVEAGSRRLADQGMAEDFSGCPYGRPFAYHRVDSIGARVELVDAARQPGFLANWHPGGDAMPAISEKGGR